MRTRQAPTPRPTPSPLLARRWRLHDLGDAITGGGFIAEIPAGLADSVWAVHPRGMGEDGTAAGAPADHLGQFDRGQLELLRRLMGEPDGQGRVV